jgi:ribonuclease P protein component
MLPRGHRLRSNQEFQRVYRVGKSWAHPLAALHVLPQPGERRFGISVSKKVGNAVVRNRVRRRIRELLRALLPETKAGFDAIVVARSASAEAEYAALSQALVELFRRAGLRREPEQPPDTPYTLPGGGRPGRPARDRGGRPESGAAAERRAPKGGQP